MQSSPRSPSRSRPGRSAPKTTHDRTHRPTKATHRLEIPRNPVRNDQSAHVAAMTKPASPKGRTPSAASARSRIVRLKISVLKMQSVQTDTVAISPRAAMAGARNAASAHFPAKGKTNAPGNLSGTLPRRHRQREDNNIAKARPKALHNPNKGIPALGVGNIAATIATGDITSIANNSSLPGGRIFSSALAAKAHSGHNVETSAMATPRNHSRVAQASGRKANDAWMPAHKTGLPLSPEDRISKSALVIFK